MDPKIFNSKSSGRLIMTQRGYQAFIPAPLPPKIEFSGNILTQLADAERAMGELFSTSQTLAHPLLLSVPLLRFEAVFSSRIEGTRASLDDVLRYEGSQLALFESGGDVHEVYNYVRALEYGVNRIRTLPISLRLIRELHAILMKDVRGEMMTPGEFRTRQNWIGAPGSTLENAAYVPPPCDEMAACLGSLESYIHKPQGLPAVARLALVHYQFEAIHPFADGNGRIGRLLVSLLAMHWGLQTQPVFHISPYLEANRDEYYRLLLAVSQKGDWNSWLAFFFKAAADSCRSSAARLQALDQVRETLQVMAGKERNPSRALAAVDEFIRKPVFSVSDLALRMGIPFKSAQRLVDRFTRLGILREITGRARSRMYAAGLVIGALK